MTRVHINGLQTVHKTTEKPGISIQAHRSTQTQPHPSSRRIPERIKQSSITMRSQEAKSDNRVSVIRIFLNRASYLCERTLYGCTWLCKIEVVSRQQVNQCLPAPPCKPAGHPFTIGTAHSSISGAFQHTPGILGVGTAPYGRQNQMKTNSVTPLNLGVLNQLICIGS
jgi:hypothetical protein